MRLFATPKYLEEHGTPKTMDDMSTHRLICQNAGTAQVAAGADGGRADEPRHPLDPDGEQLFRRLAGGPEPPRHRGPARLCGGRQPHLVRVLPDFESNDVPVFLAYPDTIVNLVLKCIEITA